MEAVPSRACTLRYGVSSGEWVEWVVWEGMVCGYVRSEWCGVVWEEWMVWCGVWCVGV